MAAIDLWSTIVRQHAFRSRCKIADYEENADMERQAGHADLAAMWQRRADAEREAQARLEAV